MYHRQNTVLYDDTNSEPGWATNYTVTVYPVGARAASNSAGTTITVDAPHSFRAGDKYLISPGTDDTFSGVDTVQSTTATTIVMGQSVSVSAGDRLVNLGPDTGTSAPNYDASPMAISAQPDMGSPISNAQVTCSSLGAYDYYYRGDGKAWELIRDSSGDIVECVDGFSGLARLNVADFGAKGDGSTDDSAAVQAALTALDDYDVAFFPQAVFHLDTGVEVDSDVACSDTPSGRAQVGITLEGPGTLEVDSAIVALSLKNLMQCTVRDLYFDGNNTASSTGIKTESCWTTKIFNVHIGAGKFSGFQTGVHLQGARSTVSGGSGAQSHECDIVESNIDCDDLASSVGILVEHSDTYIARTYVRGSVDGVKFDKADASTSVTENNVVACHIYPWPSTTANGASNPMTACINLNHNTVTSGAPNGIYITDCHFGSEADGNFAPIKVDDGHDIQISSNNFTFGNGKGTASIEFSNTDNSGWANCLIWGNSFDYSRDSTYTGDVISYDSEANYRDSQNHYVFSNQYIGTDRTDARHKMLDYYADTADGDATPSIRTANVLKITNTSRTKITNIDDCKGHQTVTLWNGDKDYPAYLLAENKFDRIDGTWYPNLEDEFITLYCPFGSDNSPRSWWEIGRSHPSKVVSEYGAYSRRQCDNQLLTALSGATVATTGTLIPAGALVLGVTAKVSAVVTGATTWDIGISGGDTDKWGSAIALTKNTTVDGTDWTDGATYWAAAGGEVLLTANGSNFTAGSILVTVHYIQFVAPTDTF